MKKLVLVTGATGFLGSHLMSRHLNDGDYVLGIDNYSSSSKFSPHSKELMKWKTGHVSWCDITSLTSLSHSIDEFSSKLKIQNKDLKFDTIYNMACPASPPIYQKIPIDTIMTCTVGVKNILDIAQRDGAKFLQASTSEVYGDPIVSPQSETYRGNVNTWGPRANYDEGKRCAEALCYEYRRLGVDVRVVRIFNTYGPHIDPHDGRVISNFIRQAGNGEQVTVYGDGSQTRSFCYVSDMIEAFLSAMTSVNHEEPINVGNPNEFTMLQLVEELRKLYPNLTSTFMPLPIDDPKQRCPDITLAKEKLGWEPNVDLLTGLSRLAEYWYKIGVIKTAPAEVL